MHKIANHLDPDNEDIKASRTKLLIYIAIVAGIILLVFLLVRIMPIQQDNSPSNRLAVESTHDQYPKNESLIKKHLLFKINNEVRSSKDIIFIRNIFKGQNKPLSLSSETNKDKPKEPEPQQIIPPLKLKLVGIIAKSANTSSDKNELLAILADEEGTYFVKKGDLLLAQYEILDVGQETVEIRNIQFNKKDTLKLIK